MPRIIPVILLLLPACRTTDPRAEGLETLTAWMTGTFSSEAQAKADPDNFFAIRLVMVPVWTERSDGPWLYVEQAAMRAVQRPYRQRVYHLTVQRNGVFRSDVYTLPGDPLKYAGKWDLKGMTPDDLKPREGCSTYLRRVDKNRFAGATQGKQCKSKLGDATYATSEVVVAKDGLASWDRGFDAADKQAWGATKGPYEFRKLSDASPRSASRNRR